MKLYTAQAPNPFRVSVFLKEKGIEVPEETVDIMAGETRKPSFLKINSLGELPVLELDGGVRITESVAICRYLEASYPETPLMGANALAKARIEMWNRRMEQQIMGPIGEVGLHTFPLFADKIEQHADYAESQRRLMSRKWGWLNEELSDGRTYVCDDAFSIADITGMAALMICDFAGESPPEKMAHVKRWEAAVRGRTSWSG